MRGLKLPNLNVDSLLENTVCCRKKIAYATELTVLPSSNTVELYHHSTLIAFNTLSVEGGATTLTLKTGGYHTSTTVDRLEKFVKDNVPGASVQLKQDITHLVYDPTKVSTHIGATTQTYGELIAIPFNTLDLVRNNDLHTWRIGGYQL